MVLMKVDGTNLPKDASINWGPPPPLSSRH